MNEATKQQWIAETLARANAMTETEARARLRELGETHGVSAAIETSLQAIDRAKAAQRRRAVREAVESIVGRVEAAGSDEHEAAVSDAYTAGLALLAGAGPAGPTWAAALARSEKKAAK